MTGSQSFATVSSALGRPPQLLIDGAWCEACSGRRFDVFDPATGNCIAQVAEGAARDVDLAVAAARRSFDDRRWRGRTGDERARILWRFAELLEANADRLARLEVLNNGMILAFARWAVEASASWLRYHAGLTQSILGSNASSAMSGGGQKFHAYTSSEPVGVAALILPWNGPIGIFVVKVAAALAAGCSVVVKPAENTPLTALLLADLALQAGVPAGVLNVVTGFGATAGQALVDHSDVDKVSFTGSTAVGKSIVRAAAGNLKRVTLELGGKSPCIVFDDANLERAISGAANGIFGNTGQVCSAGSRLFVQRKSFDKVVAGISDIAKAIKVGSGFDPETQIGPLISDRQRRRVCDYVALGRAEGAEVVSAGTPIPADGFFVEPIVFANVNAGMRIVREEIFGPVLVATPFDDVDDMLRLANDTRYGLASGIFTDDVNKAHLVAERLQAGAVWINGYGTIHPTMPLGGFKESGWGRELGPDGVEVFLEKKSVFITLREPS
jgi:acyl-CoA reductase-like NAD-dependent aldehyde dehydrogenase